MRELTSDEQALRDKRRTGFDAFFQESIPVVVDFVTNLELPEPHMVLIEPEKFQAPIGAWMSSQQVTAEDRVWILTRLGYFVGHLLNSRHGGHWFLNEAPDSRYFLRYVVGRFTRLPNPNAMVDPFHVADVYLSEPPGRSLSAILNEVEYELRSTSMPR
jgi:hypothetical protein